MQSATGEKCQPNDQRHGSPLSVREARPFGCHMQELVEEAVQVLRRRLSE